MKSLSDLSLQKRVNLLVAVSMVVGLGLFSWLGVQSLNESTARALDERLTVARIVASHMDETLDHVLVHVGEAAPGISSDGFELRAKALSATLMQLGISIEGIYLFDGEGKVQRTAPPLAGTSNPSFSGQADIRDLLNKGVPAISPLVSAPLTGTPVAFAVVPILGDDGKAVSALGVAMDVNGSGISGFIKPITLDNTGYTEIVDTHGIVLARTTPGRPPDPFERSDHPGRFAQLMVEGKATVRTCHRCHGPEDQPQRRRDVLAFAPLSVAPWGVAIRQSEEETFAITQQLKRRLLILGAMSVVTVFLMVWIVTQGVVRPIKMLTAASARVAAGDFSAVVPLRRKDEIGKLSTAFAAMTRDLTQARDEIWTRNQELIALNSIAATVSQTLRLEDVLEKALQKVLAVVRAEAGCVFLRRHQSNALTLVSRMGPSKLFLCAYAESVDSTCACHQVLRLGSTLVVNDVSQCPALSEALATGDTISCFVCVPLQSKDKTLGIMNLACSRDWCITESDLRLLQSIGRHVGLAVENSLLFEETRREEDLRGQLLTAVITAQEDERRRISRDLHDGLAQTLTGLIMNIESAENLSTQENSGLHSKLSAVHKIAANALEDLRKMMRGLRPTALDDLGLVAAIQSYAETHLESAGIHVDFATDGQPKRLPPAVETALFRITQEAINNITKHARARNVKISLATDNGMVRLTVEDDGHGFDVRTLSAYNGTQSLGLLGMRERATLLSGTFKVRSIPGQGTCITVGIPISDKQNG
ncbi:MAG: GAF domain-containing protein [Chloroflexi bacterium]|nr:GAF domain-containing protein [Chloroflexota bacterium]